MKLAVAQVAPVLGELQANLDRSRELIAQAVAKGAELIVFPELNLSGYLTRNQLALTANDPRLRAAIDAAGEPRHVQRKLILPSYPPFTEGQNFHPGNALRAVDTPLGRAAILLCEDAVQPGLATVAVHDGAELLLLPANSAHSRLPEVSNREHWHAITSCYSRLTQSFVIFANRVGQEGPFRFWGGSHVVDPRGRIVAQAAQDEKRSCLSN